MFRTCRQSAETWVRQDPPAEFDPTRYTTEIAGWYRLNQELVARLAAASCDDNSDGLWAPTGCIDESMEWACRALIHPLGLAQRGNCSPARCPAQYFRRDNRR
jgi:hypothetical protein